MLEFVLSNDKFAEKLCKQPKAIIFDSPEIINNLFYRFLNNIYSFYE